MIVNKFINPAKTFNFNLNYLFSVKKKQVELTIKTPYRTIVQDFTNFTRLITRDLSSILVLQNRIPPALHILPPGYIKLRLSGEVKGVADQYIHTGGWAIVHADNSIEINLMDALEKKQIRADLIDKVEVKDQDTLTGKYIAKVRRTASKAISKRLI